MITIVDYGVGNLESISRAFERLQCPSHLITRVDQLENSSGIILPGVGAFDAAMEVLETSGLSAAIIEAAGRGVPVLGICLGMQILFGSSEEGQRSGLGLLPGRVVRLKDGQRIPHLGWNWVQWRRPNGPHSYYYFAHSYAAVTPSDIILAHTRYGDCFPAAVAHHRLCGVQFHPEKSGHYGLSLLNTWATGRLNSCY